MSIQTQYNKTYIFTPSQDCLIVSYFYVTSLASLLRLGHAVKHFNEIGKSEESLTEMILPVQWT